LWHALWSLRMVNCSLSFQKLREYPTFPFDWT
jgi:hypothetical protein